MAPTSRSKVEFPSGGEPCAAWFYPGRNGACVIMATGAGVTKEPGTDRFAERFQAAGYGVLAFDFRHFGESGGRPRQTVSLRRQLQDLRAAIGFAATLPGVQPSKLIGWGFSVGGGHVLLVARDAPLAAAVAQTPLADGLASSPAAIRHETVGVILRLPLIALADLLGALLGRAPRLVPLSGSKGTVAVLTTPDAQDDEAALDPEGRYPEWIRAIAARSVLPLTVYRPGRGSSAINCPLLVVVARDDQSVLAAPAEQAARRAPQGELVCVDGGHYAPFLAAHEEVVAAELDFLSRHLKLAQQPDREPVPLQPGGSSPTLR